jgi:hypothetical protein
MAYFEEVNNLTTNNNGGNNFPTLLSNQNFESYETLQEFYELEVGEVVDIILNENHPSFKTYEDIGKIKVRLIHSEKNTKEESLN